MAVKRISFFYKNTFASKLSTVFLYSVAWQMSDLLALHGNHPHRAGFSGG
jgi:hypothetical protein